MSSGAVPTRLRCCTAPTSCSRRRWTGHPARWGPSSERSAGPSRLRPGARALIWDFRPGVRPYLFGPRHAHLPDPIQHTRNAPLRVMNATPWPWPWRFNLTQRLELVRADGHPR
jgi:hypothetical protein